MDKDIIQIVLASDDNYAPFVLTTILSVAKHTEAFCHFWVLDNGICEEKRKIIIDSCRCFHHCEISFIPISADVVFQGMKAQGYISLATFSRFLIPMLLPDIRKIIYMDVDILAFGDIAELYALDLGAFAVGAVPDQTDTKILSNLKNRVGMAADSVYFNAGVMLMNLDEWRRNDTAAALLRVAKEYQCDYLSDQDILNHYYEKNYAVLDQKFNWQINGSTDCVLRHYISLPKPWDVIPAFCTQDFADFSYFWEYLRQTPFYDDIVSRCKIQTPQQLQFHRFFRKKFLFKQQ